LSPADFGLVAIAMSVLFVVEAVSELPIGPVLIRLPVLDRGTSINFTIGILRALALAVVLCALAWPIAQLYGDHHLIGLLCSLGSRLRAAASEVLFIEFPRRFDFRAGAAIDVAGKSLAFLTSASLARWTGSYWSISAGALLRSVRPPCPTLWRRIAPNFRSSNGASSLPS
jgi:PST family polysaccharide transporter